MKKDKAPEYRSPEVQEIIGEIPHWLIRWGMTAVFTVVLILIFLSWFIRYPETVIIPVTIQEAGDNIKSILNNSHLDNKFIAEGFVDEKQFLDIYNGQIAHIRLTVYPFHEYGTLKGIIVRKSEIQENTSCQVIVGLPNGLITGYNKKVAYHRNMTGSAEIIIRDFRIIERIFVFLLIKK